MVPIVLLLRVLFQKAPRWVAVALWALVAVRLLVPVLPSSPVGVVPSTHVEQVIETIVPPTPSAPKTPSMPSAAPPSTDTALVGTEAKAPVWSVSQTLFGVWAVGAAAMLTYAIVSTVRLSRRMREATKWQDRVFQSERCDSPFVLGWIRPRIYIPYGLSEEERDFVLAHERAHLRRGDHLIKPFGFLLLSVYWFQPLLWVAYVCLCRDIEAACDEKVIAGLEEHERRRYSHTLVSLGVERRRIAACPVAFGEVGLKERVKRVMHYKKPTVWIVAIVLVLTAVASVCLLTNRESPPPAPQSTFEGAVVKVVSNGHVETMAVQPKEEMTVNEVVFTVQKVDLEQMEVTVAFDTPLWMNGAKTTQVVLPYDADEYSLRTDAKDGEVATYCLEINMPTAVKTDLVGGLRLPNTWNTDYDTHQTVYKAEDMTVTLYPHYFTATFGRLADHTMNGTYTWSENTLTLTEDGRLTEYVFRKGENGALRYDAAASYRHPKAKSLDLSDGFTLAFSYRYEITRQKDERGVLWDEHAYRILDWDGTVIATDTLSECPLIEEVSDGLLRIEHGTTVEDNRAFKSTVWYVDLHQKKRLDTYNELITDRDAEVVMSLYQPEAGGLCYVSLDRYNGYMHGVGSSYTNVQRFRMWGVRDLSKANVRAALRGERLSVSFVDQEGKPCTVAYDWQTGDRITE